MIRCTPIAVQFTADLGKLSRTGDFHFIGFNDCFGGGGGGEREGKVCITARYNHFCQRDPFKCNSIKVLGPNFIMVPA